MPDLSTPTCDLLGIAKPIVQAPVSVVPEVIAGVSNAGGLGILQATWLGASQTRRRIAAIKSLTDRPFGTNYVVSLMGENEHADLDYALEAGVPVISTFWGDPAPFVERVHAAGALLFHTVGSAQEARRAVDAGVDVVVAQGVEAGGHVWGEVSTLALVPAVVDAVPDAHVIAAGGIADGRGLAAVLALGAGAAWVGTRFVMSRENRMHPEHRARMQAARETDTLHSSLFDIGWPDAPHRALVNDTVETWLAAGSPPSGERPGEGEAVAHHAGGEPIPRYSMEDPLESMTGDVTSMCMYAGQGIGLVNDEKLVAAIIDDMISQAGAILGSFGGD
ncbi:MAG: nitronate monooxygenase [Alphaproteobacteria bacterium]|jgi:nitronate monooxygenase|nr:nitronate monooxygenase [Rhodospirillaceae bacterium]MDG2480809.1 nitronate monooxygenase [Alphaproteobacteria bacterium]MBT6203729.1 nitronate monooxygenase [Rhodospirillaceae bacterium]MBT6510623.1 nitronate monooxygenase [Rhodospirillaceae bacterium]MBT7614645.1 nitronate monooxygenase [Rhodospirillaceae bacterium]